MEHNEIVIMNCPRGRQIDKDSVKIEFTEENSSADIIYETVPLLKELTPYKFIWRGRTITGCVKSAWFTGAYDSPCFSMTDVIDENRENVNRKELTYRFNAAENIESISVDEYNIGLLKYGLRFYPGVGVENDRGERRKKGEKYFSVERQDDQFVTVERVDDYTPADDIRYNQKGNYFLTESAALAKAAKLNSILKTYSD